MAQRPSTETGTFTDVELLYDMLLREIGTPRAKNEKLQLDQASISQNLQIELKRLSPDKRGKLEALILESERTHIELMRGNLANLGTLMTARCALERLFKDARKEP